MTKKRLTEQGIRKRLPRLNVVVDEQMVEMIRRTNEFVDWQCRAWGHDFRGLPYSTGDKDVCVRCGKLKEASE